MLKQVKVWPSGFVKGDDFAIDHCILGKVSESFDNVGILPVERLPVSRNKAQVAL
jgi:hypothetical protein